MVAFSCSFLMGNIIFDLRLFLFTTRTFSGTQLGSKTRSWCTSQFVCVILQVFISTPLLEDVYKFTLIWIAHSRSLSEYRSSVSLEQEQRNVAFLSVCKRVLCLRTTKAYSLITLYRSQFTAIFDRYWLRLLGVFIGWQVNYIKTKIEWILSWAPTRCARVLTHTKTIFFTPACVQRSWGSVVNEAGIDLLAKESMRCWIVGRAHTAKFSPSSHRICVISTRVNGRMSSHIPLPWISACSNGKFIHENVFHLPLSPRSRKLLIAWPLHPACSWTLSNHLTDQMLAGRMIVWLTRRLTELTF